jgi:nucleoside-diphosphate-sugar epimerase
MRVLVTGATGFVGACLTRRLAEAGHEVHLLLREDSPTWRLADILDRLVLHRLDLRDAAAVGQAVRAAGPEVVYHLATFGGFAGQSDAGEIIATNLLGTVNLLAACQETGFVRFVNTGSSSEYGPKESPMQEHDLLEPAGAYGVAKGAATLYCRAEALAKGLPVVTLRLFSPYGPWDDPRRLIPYVISTLLRGESPRLAGATAVRDFVFIDDVVALYLSLLTSAAPPGAVYNVGSGSQRSTGEVVRLITELIGNGVEPLWGAVAHQRQEPARWEADISLVRRELGWQPTTSLRDGLQRTIAWIGRHPELYA